MGEGKAFTPKALHQHEKRERREKSAASCVAEMVQKIPVSRTDQGNMESASAEAGFDDDVVVGTFSLFVKIGSLFPSCL